MNNHIKVITTIDLDETTCDCDAQDCQGCVPRYVVEDEVVYEQSYVRPGKTQREEVGRLFTPTRSASSWRPRNDPRKHTPRQQPTRATGAGDQYFDDPTGETDHYPTHWMPLPAQPESEEPK